MVRYFCSVNSEWAYMGRIVLIMFYEINNFDPCYWLEVTALTYSVYPDAASIADFNFGGGLYLQVEWTISPIIVNSLLTVMFQTFMHFSPLWNKKEDIVKMFQCFVWKYCLPFCRKKGDSE